MSFANISPGLNVNGKLNVTSDADITGNATIGGAIKATGEITTSSNIRCPNLYATDVVARYGVNLTRTDAITDYARIRLQGEGESGYLEIATADNNAESIIVRQYKKNESSGEAFGDIVRELTLLDSSGHTTFCGDVHLADGKRLYLYSGDNKIMFAPNHSAGPFVEIGPICLFSNVANNTGSLRVGNSSGMINWDTTKAWIWKNFEVNGSTTLTGTLTVNNATTITGALKVTHGDVLIESGNSNGFYITRSNLAEHEEGTALSADNKIAVAIGKSAGNHECMALTYVHAKRPTAGIGFWWHDNIISCRCEKGGTADITLDGATTAVGNFTVDKGDILFTRSNVSPSDYAGIRWNETASENGHLEIMTGDEGNEMISCAQYKKDGTNPFGTLQNRLTLLDNQGNTSVPKNLNVTGDISCNKLTATEVVGTYSSANINGALTIDSGTAFVASFYNSSVASASDKNVRMRIGQDTTESGLIGYNVGEKDADPSDSYLYLRQRYGGGALLKLYTDHTEIDGGDLILKQSLQVTGQKINGISFREQPNMVSYKDGPFAGVVKGDGVMEIGKYIDFHDMSGSNPSAQDYHIRMESSVEKLMMYAINAENKRITGQLRMYGDIELWKYDTSTSTGSFVTKIAGTTGGSSSLPGTLSTAGKLTVNSGGLQISSGDLLMNSGQNLVMSGYGGTGWGPIFSCGHFRLANGAESDQSFYFRYTPENDKNIMKFVKNESLEINVPTTITKKVNCTGIIETSDYVYPRYIKLKNEVSNYSDTTFSIYATANEVRIRNDKTNTSTNIVAGSNTVTHTTSVIGTDIGVYCESTGEIFRGDVEGENSSGNNSAEINKFNITNCICNVIQATSLNKRIVGIITSLDETEEAIVQDTIEETTDDGSVVTNLVERSVVRTNYGAFASHGDVLVRVIPGTYEIGDILAPAENGYGKLASDEDFSFMLRYNIPRVKITSIETGIENVVAGFIQ